MLPPRGRQLVVLRALLVPGDLPVGLEQALLLEAVQRGVERAVLHLEHVARSGANGDADPVSVLGSPLQRPEDEHVERSLQELQPIVPPSRGCHVVVNLPPW